MRRRLAALAAAALLAGVSAGRAQSLGTTAAPFLRITPLARPAGMGEAYVGVGGDLGSIHFNPAGLSTLADNEVAFTHTTYILGADFQYLAGGIRLSPEWTIAPFVTRFGIEDFQRNAAGATIGQFDNSDLVVGLSAAYQATRDLHLGGTIKYLRSELAGFHATATMGDFGIRYDYPAFPGLAFGVSVANLGGDLTFISQGDPLPLTGRAGLAYRFPSGRTIVAADVEIDREENALFHLGGEFRVAAPLVVRGGFELGGASDRSFEEAVKLGLGFESRVGTLDYAFESFDEFGTAHRFSYAYRWGEDQVPRDVTEEEATAGRRSFFGGLFGAPAGPRVSLGRFRNVTGTDELAWLERGFPEILAARFRAAGVEILPSGAPFEVSGRFAILGPGRLWVSARLVDAKEGRLVAFKDVVVSEAEVFGAAETLADQLLAEMERE